METIQERIDQRKVWISQLPIKKATWEKEIEKLEKELCKYLNKND